MSYSEAIKLVQHHQSMLSTVDEYTPEYMEGLLDPASPDCGLKLAEALGIVLKGAAQDVQPNAA